MINEQLEFGIECKIQRKFKKLRFILNRVFFILTGVTLTVFGLKNKFSLKWIQRLFFIIQIGLALFIICANFFRFAKSGCRLDHVETVREVSFVLLLIKMNHNYDDVIVLKALLAKLSSPSKNFKRVKARLLLGLLVIIYLCYEFFILKNYFPKKSCSFVILRKKKVSRQTRNILHHYSSLRTILIPQFFYYISFIYYITIMYDIHLLFENYDSQFENFNKMKIYSLFELIEFRMKRRKLQEIKLKANELLCGLPVIWFTQILFEACFCLIKSTLLANLQDFAKMSQTWSVFAFNLIFLFFLTYFINRMTFFEFEISNKIGDSLAKYSNTKIDIKLEEIKFIQELLSIPFVPITIGQSFNLNLTFLLSFITMIVPLAVISLNLISI